MVVEPDWSAGGGYVSQRNGRMRKKCKSGSLRSMNWQQELLNRSVLQENKNLLPTPELCEDLMGFPRGWTDLGASGPEDAAYADAQRATRGPRHFRKRLEALGNAAVPQIPMLFGEFVQLCEFGTAQSIGGKHGQYQENAMSEKLPSTGLTRHENSEQPLMMASPVSQSAEPQGNGGSETGVIAEAEAYLRSYLSFPDDRYYLPLALFAALEQCWGECFDEVPYLSVSAAVKSAGKTRVLELLSFLAGEDRAVLVDGSITEAALYAEIEGQKTILIDESERLRTPRSPFRPILNGGYRRGQFAYRKIGGRNVRFPNYCPKVFSHLGDVSDSLRDRCIVIHMQRTLRGSRKDYIRTVAESEGSTIGERMHEAIAGRFDEIKNAYVNYHELCDGLTFLRDRDREIWKPLFSLCQVLAPSRIEELERSAADIAALKTIPALPFESLAEEERQSEEAEYSERLLADCILIMDGKEKMATSELVQGLRTIPTSPWRIYRGNGITDDTSGAMMMAGMLGRFGVKPRTIRLRPRGDPNSTAKGYVLADLAGAARRSGLHLEGGTARNSVTPAAIRGDTPGGSNVSRRDVANRARDGSPMGGIRFGQGGRREDPAWTRSLGVRVAGSRGVSLPAAYRSIHHGRRRLAGQL